MSSSVTAIDSYAFTACTGITEVILPTGVTKIGYQAFASDTSLAKVVIYDKVKTINSTAFQKATQCKIIGYRNSTAETFAKENSLTFESIKYDIKFDANGAKGGSTAAMSNRECGVSYTLTANGFTKTGYKFTGWNTKADGKGTSYKNGASVKDLTTKDGATVKLYAQWKIVTYNIKYELNGGKNSSKNPTVYTMKTKTIKLAKPTRKGYKFMGWYSDKKYKNQVKKITKGSTGDKTLYAKWTANKYTIKFDGNGAKSGSTKRMASVKYGTKVKLTKNGFKRTGYEFTGWNTKKDGKGKTYKNKAAVKNLTTANGKTVTLYAQWKLKKYTISYELNGGKNSSKNPTVYTMKTKTIKLTKPTRKGYKFMGWYSDSACKNRVTTIESGSTGNVKLYAKWEKNKNK